MAYLVSSFKYDPGSGVVTWTPTWPPMQKPGAKERVALRHDSDSISGYRQSITEHVTKFFTLTFKTVPQSDETNWAAFIDYAITGGAFDYYADSVGAPSTFETYTLDDTDWKPAFAYRTMDTFSLKMRLVGASS